MARSHAAMPVIATPDIAPSGTQRHGAALFAHMTTDKFRDLCDAVLLPKFGTLLHRQLTTLHEDIDTIACELARIGIQLDRIEAATHNAPPDEHHRR